MADKIKTNNDKTQKSQAATLKEVIRRLGRYRIFLVFSILLATVSVALTLYIPKLTGHAVAGFTTVILLLLFSSSVVMISLGIIGYYIARIYEEIKGRPRYIISSMVGGKK